MPTGSSDIQSVDFQGFPVHYKEYNRHRSEIPLVYIGGAFQNITRVEAISQSLARERWVITIDTPGNGATGVLPSNYGFDFICEAVHHTLKVAGVAHINLLAGSYGSIVALRYVQKYLGVDHLVLASAMSDLPDRLVYDFNLFLFLLEWDQVEEFAQGFTDLMTNPDIRDSSPIHRTVAAKLKDALVTAPRGLLEQFIHNTRRILHDGKTDITALPDITTTVIAGEHDQFVPLEANREVAQAFRHGSLQVIHGADHMMHVQKRKEFVRLVMDATEAHAAYQMAG